MKIFEKVFVRDVFYKVLFILVGIILGIGLTFLYIQKYGIPSKSVLQNLSKVEEVKQIKQIVDSVGKLMLLPSNEDPSIATITDVSSLVKEQPFYNGAKNGDIVIVYQKALKAIIHSPERNIIVNVGPITVQSEVQKESSKEQPVIDDKATSSEQKINNR
ncbi:MAG: hypothetical protein WCR40_02335 [Candidatus Paceibacterota bacterium]